jgi:hypothetical protein
VLLLFGSVVVVVVTIVVVINVGFVAVFAFVVVGVKIFYECFYLL